jgi:hypothetical protein
MRFNLKFLVRVQSIAKLILGNHYNSFKYFVEKWYKHWKITIRS